MTLKEKILDKYEDYDEILVKNNNNSYIFNRKKHKWHSLEISKLMKKDINLFLKKETKDFFIKLQIFAKRQIEIKEYLRKLQSEDNFVFNKMFKSKYYEEQKTNIKQSKELIKKFLKKDLNDFISIEHNIEYINNDYVIFLIDNKWFETISFYLFCSLKFDKKIYLDIDIKSPSGEMKQIDNLIFTNNSCIIVECKSGDNFTEGEITKIRIYKEDFGANLGIILRCKEKVEHSLKEDMVNIYIIDGVFNKTSSKIKKEITKLIRI